MRLELDDNTSIIATVTAVLIAICFLAVVVRGCHLEERRELIRQIEAQGANWRELTNSFTIEVKVVPKE